MKRGLFYVVSGLVVAGFSSVGIPLASAQQDKYPSRAVEIIIPYDPGGPTDRVMRVIGEQLPEALKASIVQINRPGGGGIAGAVFVKQQKPDGYTLLAHASGFQITPLLDRNCPYKLEEFKPLARFTQGPLVLAVKKDSPWKSVEDFLAAAKAAPGKVTVGIPGVGTIQDFVVRLMERSSHNELNPIVLKGDGPNATALLGAHPGISCRDYRAGAPSQVRGIEGIGHYHCGEVRGLQRYSHLQGEGAG
ncbi:MAG: tripartite tricarboxylate transporter substrate binding protein [Burkholderiaceae bacterium]|nr:tripartite tricarboxylate transporter substrate binding protein [Burkholderiaceae bacterium]